jgi:hypothetical protein
MPTRRLPPRPSLGHLKYQAKDLRAHLRAGALTACQRIREFHPRFGQATDAEIRLAAFTLSDAQLVIAREHGFPSWARLRAHVAKPTDLDLPAHERIEDSALRHAVDLLDAGNADGLREHLANHPGLVHQRAVFEGGNYFRDPTLLEFVAGNPVRRDHLPSNIVEIAGLILEAGATTDSRAIDSTLGLVCSGRQSREWGVQVPLIELLCDHGADVNGAMMPALAHGEFDAASALVRRGARATLEVAAATGWLEDARRILPLADAAERHRALALAALHGHADIVRLLLDAGEDPNRYNPVGCHAHATPLHQAALAGHVDVVRLLVERGARLDLEDIQHHGTAADWAEFGGRGELAADLRRGS